MRRGRRINLFARVLGAVLLAATLTLLAVTATVVSLVQDDKEANLVDVAITTTRHRGDAVRHRVELAQALLRAVAFAAESGHLLDVPQTAEGTLDALVGWRDGTEVFEASADESAIQRLRDAEVPAGESVRVDGTTAILAARTSGTLVVGLVELEGLLEPPAGWIAELHHASAAADTPLVARREGEQVRVEAPILDGLVLRMDAPLAPARAAAFEISRRVVFGSALVIIPLFLLAWVLSRRVTSPIRSLVRAVVESGDQPIEVPQLPMDEVGELGDAIGAMSQRLHKDARALRSALLLGQNSTDSNADYLRELEEALHSVAGKWDVVASPDHAVYLQRLGLTEEQLSTHLEAARHETIEAGVFEVPGGRVVIPLLGDGSDFGVAVAPTGATTGDIRVARLLVRTTVGNLNSGILERKARVGEKLAMLSRLSASVAHEMNTPLAFVNANLMAMEDEPLSEDGREMIADARIGIERLVRIVRDLSSASAGGRAISNERVSVAKLIRDMATMAQSRRPQGTVRVEVDPQLHAEIDRGRIEQVVLNLINNALDASGPDAEVRVTGSVANRRVVIDVQDNGPGIAPDMHGKLFEAFHTSKGDHGTGLGLYISRSFVEAHGGSLELLSSGSEGSVFRIELPHSATIAPTSANPPPQSGASLRPQKPRVLVVDDDPAMVRGMRRWLKARADVYGTVDAHEGLRHLRGQRFDLILCDMNMPGMSGEEFAERLRAQDPSLLERLVIVTGSTDEVFSDLHVVRKPLESRTLEKLLEPCWMEKRAS